MDPKQITRQMNAFNKTAFENSFTAVCVMQDQTEKMVNTCLEQMPLMTEEGRKMVGGWMDAHRQGRDQFKKAVDEHFKKMDSFLNGGDTGGAKTPK